MTFPRFCKTMLWHPLIDSQRKPQHSNLLSVTQHYIFGIHKLYQLLLLMYFNEYLVVMYNISSLLEKTATGLPHQAQTKGAERLLATIQTEVVKPWKSFETSVIDMAPCALCMMGNSHSGGASNSCGYNIKAVTVVEKLNTQRKKIWGGGCLNV